MSHYAKINNGIVENVIVAESSFFDTFVDSSPGDWIETYVDDSIRKNYAGVGYSYDPQRDAFIPPQPYPSWLLNEDTCQWDAPIPYPEDNKAYSWDEATLGWKEV
jgi:hypothetical protein